MIDSFFFYSNSKNQLNFRYFSIYFNSNNGPFSILPFFRTSTNLIVRTRYAIRVNRPFYRCNNGMTVGGNLSPSI